MDKLEIAFEKLNKEISWMIGIWTGDNWSHREGSVIKNNKRTSGRFGINNNDIEVIERFQKGLKNEFQIQKIKIDVQMPRHAEFDKNKIKTETSTKFRISREHINVYKSSPWRRHIGYAVYTNNTDLLRKINSDIYKKLPTLIKTNSINIYAFLQGLVDSEGTVDKANKMVKIVNKDEFVIQTIAKSLKKVNMPFKTRMDRDRAVFQIKDLKNFRKIGVSALRKKKLLDELLSGNFTREKDKEYLKMFEEELKKGATAKELSEKFNIPHTTIKLVLRNLTSSEILEWKQDRRAYIYHLT